ncbi:hypothetical protein BDS110ZK12_19360 [Bradyrhizobium diazoefficiens]|nr:hypothetical protein H12S4_13040 [Bradyrhizobium diazoefficiens]BCE97271.1 hypothetical protein XF11B_12920 [Bradyrhizobium diazoefficiens]BCF05924.1 hypothetical protein XF12B_12970 [Bradyrhizobium diazoefficiens]
MMSAAMASLTVVMADPFIARAPLCHLFIRRKISMGTPFITPCAHKGTGARGVRSLPSDGPESALVHCHKQLP